MERRCDPHPSPHPGARLARLLQQGEGRAGPGDVGAPPPHPAPPPKLGVIDRRGRGEGGVAEVEWSCGKAREGVLRGGLAGPGPGSGLVPALASLVALAGQCSRARREGQTHARTAPPRLPRATARRPDGAP